MDVSTANLVPTSLSTFGILSLLQSATAGGSSSPISSPSELLGTLPVTSDVCTILSSDDASSLDSIENIASCATTTSEITPVQYSQGRLKSVMMSQLCNAAMTITSKDDPMARRSSSARRLGISSNYPEDQVFQRSALPASVNDVKKAIMASSDVNHDYDSRSLMNRKPMNRMPIGFGNTLISSTNCAAAQAEACASNLDLVQASCDALHQLPRSREGAQKSQSSDNQLAINRGQLNSQSHHLMRHLHMHQNSSHLFSNAELAAAAASSSDICRRMQYTANNVPFPVLSGPDCMSTQKAVAFLAGPRERIHVLGNPVEHCPRCHQKGLGTIGWRPHRHIGELKIRYICERNFDDLESNHHFDIPLCPVCNQVLYLYDFNSMLGVSNARRLHKFVLKCANRHVLPLLDLFCQTKKGGERCNANFKLQWCYGTMVKRCEAQKNRDHDLWWVRYKNEWKQRRTIIRYKKDFLSHLTDVQRSLLLGLGLEGEPPPDPKSVLGSTFDTLLSSVVGSPNGPKVKKRSFERSKQSYIPTSIENFGIDSAQKQRRYRQPLEMNSLGLNDYSGALTAGRTSVGTHSSCSQQRTLDDQDGRIALDSASSDSLRYVMGAVVFPSQNLSGDNQLLIYLNQHQSLPTTTSKQYTTLVDSSYSQKIYVGPDNSSSPTSKVLPSHSIITGTPTPPLTTSGVSPVAVSVVGKVIAASVITGNLSIE